jgi:hypothetical protein
MLAVQTRNPGRGYPPPGPWPHWNDLAGESSDMVFEIHSKLASKRQEMAPFHTERLRDAGLAPAPSTPMAEATAEPTAPMSSAAASGVPQRHWPPPQLGFDESGGYDTAAEDEGKGRGQMPVVQAQEVVVGRPIGHIGQMDSAAAYETPSDEYHSAGGGAQLFNISSEKETAAALWPGSASSKDAMSRPANRRRRNRQSAMTSLSNIGTNIMNGTEAGLEFLDGATAVGADVVGALARVAQTAASGTQAIGGAVGLVDEIFGGAPHRRRQRAIRGGGGGGGGGGSDSPPLAIEDANYSSSSSGTQGPLAIVDRPQFLALEDGSMAPPPQARRRRRTQAQILDATSREWLGRSAQGSSVLEAMPRTRGWSHRGPT